MRPPTLSVCLAAIVTEVVVNSSDAQARQYGRKRASEATMPLPSEARDNGKRSAMKYFLSFSLLYTAMTPSIAHPVDLGDPRQVLPAVRSLAHLCDCRSSSSFHKS